MVAEKSCPFVLPNVRVKPPATAGSVSLVCEGAEGAAHQAYAACRSGVGLNEGLGITLHRCRCELGFALQLTLLTCEGC